MSTSFHQEITFAASVEDVFNAYSNAEKHASFTGAGAEISAIAGDSFSVHDGKITGRNIDVVPNQRIVQAWRVANWPAGDYSLVKLVFSEDNGQCVVSLDHSSCPAGTAEHLDAGWHKMYWEPMASWLAK